MAVTFTQADAHAVRRLIAGLDPRNTVARPSAQDTYDCLVQLAEKANRAIHGVAVALRDDQKANLRQLVDDLYRVEPHNGPTTRCVSWHWEDRPLVADIAAAVTAVAAGTLHAREVQTGGDDYAIVISRHELDDAAGLAAWEAAR